MQDAAAAWTKATESRRSIEERGYSTPCWIFTGGLTAGGYGQIAVDGKNVLMHRLALQVAGRPTPPGMDTDHLCRVRSCFNPEHLEPVVHRVNMERGKSGDGTRAWAAARTHCRRGHPRTPDNLVVKGTAKSCLTCQREAKRAWRAANPGRG